jgi:hypothetical protein
MRTQSLSGALSAIVVLTGVASSLSKEPEVSRDDVKALIEKLASPNPEPTVRRGPELKYPPNYDREQQRSVGEAKHNLESLGARAFGHLIENWKDNRYSLTYSVGINGYMRNATVGHVCKIIVFDQVQPYGFWPRTDDDPRGKPHRPSYPSLFLADAKSARAWLEKHKGKPLYEIQLMVIDWVIDEESKRPTDYSDSERKSLSDIRAKLIETKRPIGTGNYYNCDYD